MASHLKNKCWFVTRSLEAECLPRIATRSHGSWHLLLAFVFKPKVLPFFVNPHLMLHLYGLGDKGKVLLLALFMNGIISGYLY